ncbi:hypothetical protein NP233_g10159 [Leucocoprinus birnbaumii]|uniref:Uncharacterized protein n=1 Tax=Leucocoprinus birnbaumii TaxID=56174 RepID=A0AAD5VKU7_9AGAR|nr:hypothetical protein NP233_g10159 [Leucocoprinus birnbaumii]
MANFYWHLYLLSVLLSKLSGVLSALYPTQPVANTVFYCGDSALITWVDTHRKPHVTGLGALSIKLYTTEDDYVATLAQGVNPVSFGTLVALPMDLRNDTLYNLRFSAPSLSEDVWTADFEILPQASNLKSNPHSTSLSALSVSSGTSLTRSRLPSSLVSSWSSSSTMSTSSRQTISEITPITTIYPDSSDGSTSPPRRNGAVTSRADQLNQARFRLLFIVWPAMFGLSMAL